MSEERFDRQIRLFGEEGQEAIERTAVAIVGLGGLGSHVVQQLAYLGTQEFILLDGDKVEDSNLNRLIGARPADVDSGTKKVVVAKGMIKEIAPETVVTTYPDFFVTDEGFNHIRSADVVFGTMDNDGSRLILNELCQAYEVPYLDLASDVDGESGFFGGRLVFSFGGNRCLICDGEIDQGALDAALSTEEERQDERAIYGVPQAVLGAGGPAVVSINGVVASLAVTEFMTYVTGLRSPETHLTYDGRTGGYGGVRSAPKDPGRDCYFCDTQRGRGAEANVERYLRNGVAGQLRGSLTGA